MIKKLLFLLILFSFFFIFKNHISVQKSIIEGCYLFINNLFPSLFPILVISYLLINYNLLNIFNKFFYPINKAIFKINECASLLFITSILTGSPGNAKTAKELYDKHLITKNDIQKVLFFSHFSNPIFIMSIVKQKYMLVIIAHYISNFILGFIYRNKYIYNTNSKFDIKEKEKSYLNIFFDSINSSINTLLFILGTIITFYIITSIINIPLLKIIIELCQSMKYIQLLSINIKYKSMLYGFILSFGGICIHCQVFGILNDIKIKYIPYLFSRILHGIICSTIIFILY